MGMTILQLYGVIFAEAVQPQGVQIPLKNPLYSPLQTRLSLATPPPPPPCHGGWPSPARPSRMKFQPRPRFEALAVRGGRIFRSNSVSASFWGFWRPLDVPGPPEGPWTPLEPLGRPWSPLEAPARPWSPETAWKPPTCMDETE